MSSGFRLYDLESRVAPLLHVNLSAYGYTSARCSNSQVELPVPLTYGYTGRSEQGPVK